MLKTTISRTPTADVVAASGVRARALAGFIIAALGIMQALLLFFLGKSALGIAVLTVGLVLGATAASGRPEGPIANKGKERIGWRRMATCLAIALLVHALGGEGRFVYANTDWQVRNAVLLDLVNYPWPFAYIDGAKTEILRAPLGMYLLPALIGKLAGFRAAELALLAQNALLLALVLALGSTLYESTRARWIALGVFLGFSGLDVIGQLIAGRPIWLHLEQWANIQFTAHLTQIFWVPQHALAGWFFALFYMMWREGRIARWIVLATVPLSALLSPLAMMGMLPFAAHVGIDALVKRQLRWSDFVLPGAAVIAAGPSLLYLTAGSDSVGSRVAPPAVLTYVIFIALEIGFYAFALWQLRDRLRFGAVTGAIVLAVLLLTPLVQVGEKVDFVMRVSIPALAILSLMVAEVLMRPAAEGDASWQMARRWVLVAFAIGLTTPAGEVARALLLPRAPAQLCSYFGVVPNGYATYVTSLDRLPAPVRPDAAARILPADPAQCWDGPWPDAATGAGL